MSKKRNRKIEQLKSEPVTPKGLTTDAFQNVLARMGFGMPNMLEGTEYPLTRLTKNYQLMNSLYRSHWIVRRIIDVIPEDMCKNWYQISSQLQPDAIERLQKLERRTQVKQKILEGLKWGRLYGGAAAIMMLDGHENCLEEPLNLDMVFPGSFKGLLIVDRWSGIYPGPDLVTDVNDPDFGLPNMYQVTNEASRTNINVHHSRLLRFIGRNLPAWELQAEMYWGASEVEHVFDELKKRDNTSWNIAQLVFLANLRVLKMNDLGQMLATANDKVQKQIYDTVQAQNWLMNNMGMYLIDKDDDFDTKQYTFSGLAEIYENFMMDVAGAAEMPVTKLFGRSPAGMNATGESDMQNYYDTIEEKQESYLRPVLDKLLPVMFMSELGALPDDLDYRFNPVRRASDTEKSDLGAKLTSAVVEVFNAGLIGQRTALRELRQMEDITSMWSNITDEDIERAEESPQNPGEDLSGLLEPLNFNKPSAALPTADGDFKESDHPRNEKGQFSEGGNGTSEEEKQKKIDSIKIDFDKDNILPELNKEDLVELGKESKPVLLKKSILAKNEKAHPDISREDYPRIIGHALYKPDAIFPGHMKEPRFNFVARLESGMNTVTLLELAETKENYEIINFHWAREKSRRQLERKGERIKNKS